MNIVHVKQLGGTRYMMEAVHAHSMLLREGRSDEYAQLVSWSDEAIVALDGEQCAGVLTFLKTDHTNGFSVCLGYVLPEYRRQGVYRRMWDCLVEEAKARSVAYIWGVVRVNNEDMREVVKKLGREEESVNIRYKVGP